MESSGTYGDVLRYHLGKLGFPVYRVSGKRTHDSAVIHDGVPSMHDAKSAAIIAKLHIDKSSSLWVETPRTVREMKARLSTMEMHREHHQRLIHQLEGWLARHWPEITTLVALTTASLLALLGRIGGPEEVARREGEARELLQGMGHGLMRPEKIDAVITSARATAGVPLEGVELEALQELALEAHRALKAFKKAKGRVEELAEEGPAKTLAAVAGKATAAVLVADAGDPSGYQASRAYLKALGLNLKEKSSGRQQGALSLTKQGPSRARQWLWLAVLRWIQKDEVAAAWYARKVSRDGGKRARALVALMRKLAKALFHVARGAPFDSGKLFGLAPATR
jgi:transposase